MCRDDQAGGRCGGVVSMRWKSLKGCAFSVAVFCSGSVVHAQEPYPRLDALACFKAFDSIDSLEEAYRSVFQVQCVSMAADYCEAEVTGPRLACLADLEASLVDYVDAQTPLLPDQIDGGSLTSHFYERRIKEFRSDADPNERCTQERALDRQICRILNASTRFWALWDLAKRAGVSLP